MSSAASSYGAFMAEVRILAAGGTASSPTGAYDSVPLAGACHLGGGRAGRRLGWPFLPPPSQISRVLWQMATSGELARHIGASLSRVVWGFLIGAGPGIAIGLLIGRYRGLRAVIDPLVAATYPIPKIALLPLLLVIFGLGRPARWQWWRLPVSI